jgi:hypothetical protein
MRVGVRGRLGRRRGQIGMHVALLEVALLPLDQVGVRDGVRSPTWARRMGIPRREQ